VLFNKFHNDGQLLIREQRMRCIDFNYRTFCPGTLISTSRVKTYGLVFNTLIKISIISFNNNHLKKPLPSVQLPKSPLEANINLFHHQVSGSSINTLQ